MVPRRALRFRPRHLLISTIFFSLIVWFLLAHHRPASRRIVDEQQLRTQYPNAYKHIHSFKGKGGAWYIPPQWLDNGQAIPTTIVEAVELASSIAKSHPDRHIPFSNIPLLVHQKWNTARLNGTKEDIVFFVEQWLNNSMAPAPGSSPMAYFLWDDDGVSALVNKYEKDFANDFMQVFSPVEQVDIFRIIVCKWFGGIYGDIDTKPLRHPSTWIKSSDISEWTDELTGKSYGLNQIALNRLQQVSGGTRPVNAIWGIECDTDPETDAHWRYGYTFAVQLTNWALASAPKHPILQYFMEQLVRKAGEAKTAALQTTSGNVSQLHYDPLTRTGPAAVTEATSRWLRKHEGLRWDAVTGLKDDGKTKLAGDVLILPITGFSPIRGSHSRMGEKSWSHPDARLAHIAMGSWHHTNLIVEYGKFCRTFFGMCRDWPKMW
ncbi:hypothetical protein E4U21_007484 [Claviceps maximensis]|nr:hypothetical protein E4U21_007484 [Claviceps maximensis]